MGQRQLGTERRLKQGLALVRIELDAVGQRGIFAISVRARRLTSRRWLKPFGGAYGRFAEGCLPPKSGRCGQDGRSWSPGGSSALEARLRPLWYRPDRPVAWAPDARLGSSYRKCPASTPNAATRIPPAPAPAARALPPQPCRIAHSRTLRCRPTTCHTHEPAAQRLVLKRCSASFEISGSRSHRARQF